ncbi:serine/threonine-protein kinase [Streptosporangium roseum]|uniref:serine/threonine-protein kinase n=1 Tax=Streptosporangium roseum TaxID=2001 RepID=UPI00068A0C7D|nr:serine/threonine-protein kinase [Streptosporangium roseum]
MDTVIGPYRLVRRLGQGGTGEVFLARDPEGRQVAVKVLHPRLAADPALRQRFRQEAEAASRVARSCTVPVLDAGLDGDRAYLVTEYVEGQDLRRRVEEHGPLTGSSLDALAVSTAVALQAIHAAGVVHRDLKPSAVLLGPLGPRVTGFGMTRPSGPSARAEKGAPSCMAPEQARGEDAGAASDVFAWGGVVLYAATGRGPSAGGTDRPAGHAGPDLTGLHDALRDLAGRALAEDPGSRPSVQDILRILTGATDPATSLAQPAPAPGPPAPQPLDLPAVPLDRPPSAPGGADPDHVRPADPPGALWPPPPRPAPADGPGPSARWGRSIATPILAGVAISLVIAGIAFFTPAGEDPAGHTPATQPAAAAGDTAQPAPDPATGPTAALSPPPSPSPTAPPSSTEPTAEPATARALPFRDDFSGADRGWTTAASGKGRHRASQGAYRITAKADAYLPVIAPLTAPVKNTTITAKVRMLRGKGDFGVFCRGLDEGARRYEFSITSSGDASIVKSGEAPASVRHVPVPGLRPARLIVLQAACRSGAAGTSLSLSVNGRKVLSRLDRKRPFAAGSIGMFAHARHGGSGVEVSFNSFEARP